MTLTAAIEAACAAGPKTTRELATLLQEDPAAVAFACYHLRKRGRLIGTKNGRAYTNETPRARAVGE